MFGLAFLHARRALGTARATVELGVLVAYGYALEVAAIRAFSSHDYGSGWTLAPLGVPVAVAAVWAAVISSAMALAPRLGFRNARSESGRSSSCAIASRSRGRNALGRGVAAALVGIALDLMMEPVAVRAGLWTWTPPGPWLGVPVGNFVGWGIVVGSYTVATETWAVPTSLAGDAARRLLLAALSIGVLLAVGAAWTGLKVEALFGGALGWCVWLLLLAAAAALGRTRQPMEGSTLATRLARAPAALPTWTFAVLATVFAADAALLGRSDVGLAAVGSIAVLARLGWAVK